MRFSSDCAITPVTLTLARFRPVNQIFALQFGVTSIEAFFVAVPTSCCMIKAHFSTRRRN